MDLKEAWLNVIALAQASDAKAEDGHLNAKGDTFYSVHKTFEAVQDGIEEDDTELDDLPDECFEVFYGGRGLPFPSSNDVTKKMLEFMEAPSSNSRENGKQVRKLFQTMLENLSFIIEHKDTTDGENDLAASIAHQIQHRVYFLNNYLG